MRAAMAFVLFAAAIAFAAQPAAAIAIAEIEANNTVASAQVIPGLAFTLGFDTDIGDETTNISLTAPNASIQAVAEEGGVDFFAFYISAAGTRGIFDIDDALVRSDDGLFDARIEVFDLLLTFYAANDLASAAFGAAGSESDLDPYLEVVFPAAGTYFVAAGSSGSTVFTVFGPPETADYELQIALIAPPPPPPPLPEVPGPPSLPMLGLALALIAGGRRRLFPSTHAQPI